MPTNVVSQIQIPGGTVYDIKPSSNPNVNTNGIYYVSASGTASAWTGTLTGLTEYYDGLKLVVYNNTGADSNAAFTLKLNSLSAIPVKRYGATDGASVPIGSVIYLCYVGGKFIESHYINSTYYLNNLAVTIAKPYIESTGTLGAVILGYTTEGKLSPFTTIGGTTTGKSLVSLTFPIGQSLLWRSGSIAAGQSSSYYEFYAAYVNIDIRYSMCNWNANRVSNNTEVDYYMHVSVDHDTGTFAPLKDTRTVNSIAINDHIVTKSLERNELAEGDFYIHIGCRYYTTDSASYLTSFFADNTLYYYDGNDLIKYEIWKASGHNYADSPTAAMDIYASPEYPAFVCISPQNNYSNYNSQVPCLSGTNLLYDILVSTLATGTPEMDIDWGYAMLIHDVSMGQKVPDQYLLKRGKYTLHNGSRDNTWQGSINSIGSAYRLVDANLITEISSYVAQHPGTDGPTLYMNAVPFDYANSGFTRLFPNGPSVGGKQINSMDSRYYSCFSFMGKANLDASNQPSSITVDFTENTIYGADGSGNIQYINGCPVGISEEANPGYISENDALSPIAITDIYASPEYPALVCVSPRDEYNIYNGLGIEAMHGTNLLCDYACMGSCWPGFNQDFGYALLIHDVSMGQRVPDSYLLKQGNYPIHTDSTDTTKQGALNFVPDSGGNSSVSGTLGGGNNDTVSSYRIYDELIVAKVRDLNLPSTADGPIIYMRPYPINYETNVTDLCAGNMDVVKGSPNMYYTTQFHVKLGKGVLDSSGNLISITVDLTDDEVYGTDASGNITYINGSATGIGGNMNPSAIPETFLNNPVAGGGSTYVAGGTILSNSIVCMGTDGSIHSIYDASAESVVVDQDWGLAVYIGSSMLEEDQPIPQGLLMQQCTLPYGGSNIGTHNVCIQYNRIGPALPIFGTVETYPLDGAEFSDVTCIYAGITDGTQMHFDFSNHDFIGYDASSNISYINGRPVGGDAGGGTFTFNNTVAGDCTYAPAGATIPAKSFVVMGMNGKLYPINSSQSVNINMDWGAAYLTQRVIKNNVPPTNTLLQQCYIPAEDLETLNIDLSFGTNTNYRSLYLKFPGTTTPDAYLTDISTLSTDKFDTLIYVGTMYNNGISVDFSNHDFLQMTTVTQSGNDTDYIYAINGRPVDIPVETNLSRTSVALGADTILSSTADTSVLRLPLPEGYWMVSTQITIANNASGSSTNTNNVHFFMGSATNTTTSIGNLYRHAGTWSAVHATYAPYQNVYMHAFINCQTNTYVSLIAKSYIASRVKLLKLSNGSSETTTTGFTNATHMLAVRLGPSIAT